MNCYLVNCHQPNDTKLGHFKFSMTWLSRDIKNQSYQPEQTMGTGSCLLKTMQLRLKEASEWFIEDFLANLFWDKTISEFFKVAEAGADFSHRTPASFRVRGMLCKCICYAYPCMLCYAYPMF